MNDIIHLVARHAAITPAQAGVALTTILRVLGAGLPSPVMGQLRALLDAPRGGSHDSPPQDPASLRDPSR